MIAAELLSAVSVDVEDCFHVSVFEKVVGRSRWGSHQRRAVVSSWDVDPGPPRLPVRSRHGDLGQALLGTLGIGLGAWAMG